MEREQTWIRAIQRRNSREAAEQLIQTYYDEIYRFVYRQTGSKEDAMDLTQSVFIAVLRALPGYRAERASFRTWLYRIAANKVIDTRRKARPVSIPIQEMELPAAEDFVARVHDRALLETIEGYVSGLDPGEQAVFRLRIYGEKTFPEIAAAMGEPEAAQERESRRRRRRGKAGAVQERESRGRCCPARRGGGQKNKGKHIFVQAFFNPAYLR